MPSFRKLCVLFGCVAVTAAVVAQESGEKRADDAKKKSAAATSDKKSGGDKKKKEKGKEPMPFPLPIGHGGKGLRIPYLDGNAQKSMQFVIGTAERVEEDIVKMSNLKIEMLAQDDEPEMTINLPNSTMNLVTRVITAEKAVKIKRDDFELSGDRMVFNTVSKQGTLEGNVRMLIYNLANEIESDAPAKPEEKPKSEEKPKPGE